MGRPAGVARGRGGIHAARGHARANAAARAGVCVLRRELAGSAHYRRPGPPRDTTFSNAAGGGAVRRRGAASRGAVSAREKPADPRRPRIARLTGVAAARRTGAGAECQGVDRSEVGCGVSYRASIARGAAGYPPVRAGIAGIAPGGCGVEPGLGGLGRYAEAGLARRARARANHPMLRRFLYTPGLEHGLPGTTADGRAVAVRTGCARAAAAGGSRNATR